MKGHHAACLGATFLMLYALVSVALPARSVTLSLPSIQQAPANLIVKVTVEPVEDQRLLRVEISGEDFYRASEVQLDGTAGPRTSWIRWNDVPAGNYRAIATVRSSTRIVAREVRTCLVVGFGG